MNIFLISGNDESQVRADAEKLARELAGPDPDPFVLDVFQEDDSGPTPELLRGLIRSLLTPPFLGGRKTVWLKHFSGFGCEGDKKSSAALPAAMRELAELLRKGLPEDLALLMDGPDLDRRRALFKACEAVGQVRFFNRPDPKSRTWQQDMAACIRNAAADKGMRLEANVCDYLVDVLGTDTSRIGCELDKLICYCGGPEVPVTLADAQQVCVGKGEEMAWALSEMLGKRDLAEALRVVDVLLDQSKEEERSARSMLISAAGFFRQLLQIRVVMAEHRLGNPQALKRFLTDMDAGTRDALLADGMDFIGFHPYRVTILAGQASRYSPTEMIQAIRRLRDALRQCMSSSTSPRMALEDALFSIVGGAQGGGRPPR
ncbi:MAG: DNA polymerase III subunit delta [Lentisphaeria bacterium]|jgi:DNA polymerase III delta subunit|nr:DNA polymerase III subunit delta [Lentisphaeria bacterium]